jgi:GntR family transcriptional repressor for pyruvate dehydrogenase complex
VTNSKVYLEIVKQLREMITVDGLKTGDKIPSERELSERLNFGRSSVREALRALELLGLIETRRGEGTYIRDFRGHQLVQLLSTFILQDQKANVTCLKPKIILKWIACI